MKKGDIVKCPENGTRFFCEGWEDEKWNKWHHNDRDLKVTGTVMALGEKCIKAIYVDDTFNVTFIIPISDVEKNVKNIIGYKWKQDMEKKYGKAANLMIGDNVGNKWHITKQGWQLGLNSVAYRAIVEANLLDEWFEALYEETVKVGGYEVTFKSDAVVINDKVYSKSDLKKVKDVMSLPHFYDMSFGCSGQIHLDLKTINLLLCKL